MNRGTPVAYCFTVVTPGKKVNQNAVILDKQQPARRWFAPQKKKALVIMKMQTSRKAGFTLVEIMIVVAIIGLLAAIAIPNFVKARKTSQTNACLNNLRQIDGAKQQWALETAAAVGATPTAAAITPYLGRGSGGSVASVYCPLSGAGALAGYTINDLNTAPTCNNATAVGGDHPAILN
jgi:prepilin-type N-terminal cleavage/methylation domain-containing protein